MDGVHSKQDYWFRKMCVDVAKRLTEDEVGAISYIYLNGHLPATCATTLSKALYVFKHLEKEGDISSDKTGIAFLLEMLDELPRRDIVKDCELFIQHSGPSPHNYTHREFITHFCRSCLPMALGWCHMYLFPYLQEYRNT